MAKTLLQGSRPAGHTAINSTTVRYALLGNGVGASAAFPTTEANARRKIRAAGTIRLLYCRVLTNTTTGTTTVRLRKNTANGNGVISIATTLTGEFQDTSNTDTVVATDDVNYSITGAGTVNIVFTMLACVFENGLNENAVMLYVCSGVTAVGASATTYTPLAGAGVNTTVDTNIVERVGAAGTLRNYQTYISANTWTGTATSGVRFSGANGNQVVSILTTQTGLFEDASNTDTVTTASLCCAYRTVGANSGSITSTFSSVVFESQNSRYGLMASQGSTTYNANLTRYFPLSGVNNGVATESEMSVPFDIANTYLSDFYLRISANTVSATSTATLRKNAASTNVAISIGSNTTGNFSDTTNTVAVASGDDLNFMIVTGATGTSMTWRYTTIVVSGFPIQEIYKTNQAVNRAGTY